MVVGSIAVSQGPYFDPEFGLLSVQSFICFSSVCVCYDVDYTQMETLNPTAESFRIVRIVEWYMKRRCIMVLRGKLKVWLYISVLECWRDQCSMDLQLATRQLEPDISDEGPDLLPGLVLQCCWTLSISLALLLVDDPLEMVHCQYIRWFPRTWEKVWLEAE